MTLDSFLPTWKRLSTKIVGLLLGFLLLALLAIGATLLLSWQLEGSSAAINETGRLRMQSYRLAVLLSRSVSEPPQQSLLDDIAGQLLSIENSFARLRKGDPQRPLFLPPTEKIRKEFEQVVGRWRNSMRPFAIGVLQRSGGEREAMWQDFQAEADSFVADVNQLVHLIERDSEVRTFWLRSSQMALVSMALTGTVAIIYLMFLLIIQPVKRLSGGIQRMTEKDFSVRLPVESKDEFGELTQGFNLMADRLQSLYSSLEERVRDKTAELENQNRELALLYDAAAFLQRPYPVEETCKGFLKRICDYFGADGGSVRVLDDRNGNAHLVAHQGISPELTQAEQCVKPGECLCGKATEKKITIVHDLRRMPPAKDLLCRREGFATVAVFHILALQQHIGFFNLHFRTPKCFTPREEALLETLGQLLGVAIENLRLASREREMAVSEERNLVAQGLHDSIAQSLTFMNIQLQMLEESLADGKLEEAAEIAPALRSGVQESYDDVRELLLNFRSRLAEEDLIGALRTTVGKFSRQTGVDAAFTVEGSGPPFSREQQLQVLFIVQEALSNVRKHAMAEHVDIRLEDRRDFVLTIRDDGVGFNADTLLKKGDSHVGINIMRERAQRIHADLAVTSSIGQGTAVSLTLPHAKRRAN